MPSVSMSSTFQGPAVGRGACERSGPPRVRRSLESGLRQMERDPERRKLREMKERELEARVLEDVRRCGAGQR